MTKKEMLDAFAKAVETTTAQIEETKKTELILEGKRQAFQESYDWLRVYYLEGKEEAPEAPSEEAASLDEKAEEADTEMPTPVKEKKSK